MRRVAKLSHRRHTQDLFSQESLNSNLVLNIKERATSQHSQLTRRAERATHLIQARNSASVDRIMVSTGSSRLPSVCLELAVFHEPHLSVNGIAHSACLEDGEIVAEFLG